MTRRRLFALVAAAALLLVGGTASGYNPAPQPTWVVSGGTSGGGQLVTSVAVSGSTAYLGGDFAYVGPETGGFVGVDATTSALASPWPTVGGNVYAVAADGSGGFFIGGIFSSIGTRHADNIAHINADGTFDTSWTGSTSGTVYALAVSGTTVFAGGAFTTAGGATHANLAAFDRAANGAVVSSFNANATGNSPFVAALRLSGSKLYVGGRFTSLAGSARTNIGAVSTTGAIDSWAPTANNIVYALAVGDTGTVYAGGFFTEVTTADTDRGYLAAFSPTGTLMNWDPDADAPVFALEVSGSTVYAGGEFGFIDAAARHGLAALSATGVGEVTSWDPDPNGDVFALAVSGTTVYAGGRFDLVNAAVGRDNVVALEAATGNAIPGFWTVVGGEVDALAVSGTTVGLGGEFQTAGGGLGPTPAPLPRANLAAIDLTTGNATSWNPRTNGVVETVAVAGSTVYAGGSFTTVNAGPAIPRERLAAFDMGLGNATPWNPGVHNGSVVALAIAGSTVYAGGTFNGAGAVSNPPVTRNRVAVFDAGGLGDLKPLNAIVNDDVYALDVVGPALFIGGRFTTVSGFTRNHLAAVSSDPNIPSTTNPLLVWNPNVNDSVFTLAHAGSLEYAGGPFTLVNIGATRIGAAAFDVNGTATSWHPQVLRDGTHAGTVYSLAPSASTMYMSGIFRSVGGAWTGSSCVAPCFPSSSIAAVSLATGLPNQTWNPGANDLVSTIALSSSGLVAGGLFTAFGFPLPGTLPVNAEEPGATYRGGFALVRALPDAPTQVVATAGNGTANVSFASPGYNGGEPITSYTLTVSPGNLTMPNVTSPVSVPNLSNGTNYTFSVTATTSIGTGDPGVATATPHTIPGAPTGVTAVPGNLQATVSFNPPADNGGEAVSFYTVKASSGQTINGTASPIVFTGLQNDSPITFTVTASNSAGPGPESAPSDPVTPIEPGRKHPTPPGPVPRPAVPDVPPGLPPRIPPPHHT